ncbi:MAG TPA: proline dehydrogenase family protein [Longimicrobiales bacterium]|nr:proline dehydrogenase family protein [Longimicrobiales bacterium]
MDILREVMLYLSESPVARRIATEAPFSKTVSRRFVAGETLAEAIAAARATNAAGMTASLDYLGESVSSREEARAAVAMVRGAVERIAAEGLDANVSVKLTQLGQDIDEAFLRENVTPLLEAAAERDMFIRFDMESSAYTQRTLDFFRSMWDAGHTNTGVVLQSYLYRTEEDVRWANDLGVRVRLCKGAYKEPESVAYPDKADVDASFVRCMKLLLSEGNYPGIATHDPAMLSATRAYAREKAIPASAYEFQMLYGVRRDLQRELVSAGYNLRIYIPFGEAWYPYFMRRMAERPANMLFVMGNVVRESPLRVFMGGNGSGR